MKKKFKANDGFTLVELIVVIAILAILGGVAVPAYSGYVKKANMGVDETLAGEIKHALTLAHYSGNLTPGDYVVVKYGGSVTAANKNDASVTTADAAMQAVFGSDYANILDLQYDGWELGVVADATKMGYVNDSSYYKDDAFESMLGQVQNVVNIAGNYFDGLNANLSDENLITYVQNAGVVLGENNEVLEGTGTAVANATVFYVANNVASVTDTNSFNNAWYSACLGDASEVTKQLGGEAFSGYAASYAAVLGMATYLDSKIDEPKYVDMLTLDSSVNGQAALVTRLAEVGNAMGKEHDDLVQEYFGSDEDGTPTAGSQSFIDAMAFLTYMDGVESSADSMFESNDIYSDNYFNDGNVLNYVQNYMDTGTILSNLGINEDAFVFIYNGLDVACVPLDY